MLGLEKTTELMDEPAKPPDPMDVTVAGMTTAPTHSVCPVTALAETVKKPDVLQRMVPFVPLYVPDAWAGPREKPVEAIATMTAAHKVLCNAPLPFDRKFISLRFEAERFSANMLHTVKIEY